MKTIEKIRLVNLEYGIWGGFSFELLTVTLMGVERGFSGSLFALNIDKNYLVLNLLFFRFEISTPFL